ncbi:hypothetical protein ANCCAN_28790, partial [Ancylostoma caninum]
FAEILIQENVVDLAGRHSTVFFIATDQGKVFKVIKYALEAEARHVSSVKAVEASSPIVSLTAHIERRPNQQTAKKLLILTPTQLILLPSSMCKQQQTCTDCLSMGDPECAWVLHGAECVAVSENIFRREYLTQEVGKCGHQVGERTTTTEEPPQHRELAESWLPRLIPGVA